nr:ANR family transcriptional regulator [Pantoea cypripedii]
MEETYTSFATEAVSLEQNGKFFKASQVWRQAKAKASGANINWSTQRALFCLGAFKRSKHGEE